MKSIKEQRLDFLNETVKYYSEDTSRRAVADDGYCEYLIQETGNKCAIGRHIKLQDYLNNKNKLEGSIVEDYIVFALLPEEVRRLGKEFLSRVQMFHDNKYYWNTDKGLTSKGEERLAFIINCFCK